MGTIHLTELLPKLTTVHDFQKQQHFFDQRQRTHHITDLHTPSDTIQSQEMLGNGNIHKVIPICMMQRLVTDQDLVLSSDIIDRILPWMEVPTVSGRVG
jgi:hypothetical protein